MIKWGTKHNEEREKTRREILRLYDDDQKVEWIAIVCNCSTSYVSKVAKLNGRTRRRAHETAQ